MKFAAFVSAATVISFSTASISAYYGQSARYAVSIIRETATAAGSYAVYINGVVFASGSITAAATVSLSNAGVRYINAGNVGGFAPTTRAASSLISQFQYNRALTSAEVLDLSINGPALADRGASQANEITGAAVNFSVDQADTGVDATDRATFATNNPGASLSSTVTDVSVSAGVLTFTGVALSTLVFSGVIVPRGKNYQAVFNVSSLTDSWFWRQGSADSAGNIQAVTLGLNTLTFKSRSTVTSSTLYLQNVGSGGTISVDASTIPNSIRQLGITSELIASNAQSDTGQILDSSGNKNHALLPASGATVVGRPVSQTREVRWTNTWAGTNELQYIGGVNQAILPANAYIESIVGTVSGATPHDIIVGDGSDTDRYVTITTGLAAGTTTFTLASRTTDGTNLKLTVDPDTNSDMSIAWVIKYTTLES
jgi:hypothetical protein